MEPVVVRIPLPGDAGYPNGVALTPDGTVLIGFVDRGRILARGQGGGFAEVFAGSDSSFAATALRFDPRTNLLWVTSPDFPAGRLAHRVGAVDIERGEVVWSAPIPDGGFGNDLALDGRGGVFLTDSVLDVVYQLNADGPGFSTVARLPAASGKLGAAGIGRQEDGTLTVGQFSDGNLLRVQEGKATVVDLPRVLENPDGMVVDRDGTLLVLEGAVASGNGRLVRVDPQLGTLEALVEGLDSPLNLTLTPTGVLISESGIRHLMTEGVEPPEQRYLTAVDLYPPQDEPASIALPDGMFPESIAYDESGVAYVGGATTQGIVRVLNGRGEAFIPAGSRGLLSVQGLWAGADELFACSADLGVHGPARGPSAVVSFDLETGSPTGRWPLPGDGLCNDLTPLPDGSLLLSDSKSATIWRLDRRTASLEPWLEHPALGGSALNGNGIVWSDMDAAVYLSTFSDGRLLRIPVEHGHPGVPVELELSRPLNGADALRVVGPGRLLLFENGLTAGGGGQVTSVVVDGSRARLARLWESGHQPTSGRILPDGTLVVVESHFAHLFGEHRG